VGCAAYWGAQLTGGTRYKLINLLCKQLMIGLSSGTEIKHVKLAGCLRYQPLGSDAVSDAGSWTHCHLTSLRPVRGFRVGIYRFKVRGEG